MKDIGEELSGVEIQDNGEEGRDCDDFWELYECVEMQDNGEEGRDCVIKYDG